MSFDSTSIAQALEHIRRNKYVLPAIQREFVWGQDRICKLFDSFMQGFPVGTLLFWQVEAENSGNFRFYGFMRDYHERDNRHCPELPLEPNKELTAVLDGQQRLTALSIGLQGTLAQKKPWKRWSSDDAFPEQRLCLELTAELDESENGEMYRFRFLERPGKLGDELWFPVSQILRMQPGPDIFEWIEQQDLDSEARRTAFRRLSRLHQVVHIEKPLSYFVERRQELDIVLQIFIRMNSGGMVLSYSDLLLSVATAQWKNRDARSEVHELVDDMNSIGSGFEFSKDFVLKAGLMLLDIGSVGFKVDNFNKTNMERLEEQWDEVRNALMLTAQLAAHFGFNRDNLRADSALLPISYYIYKSQRDEGYLKSRATRDDRAVIKRWLIRSLLKASGIWGSALDTFLTALRGTIQSAGYDSFPVEAVERSMSTVGKSLAFTEEEIEELAEIKSTDKRTFPLLTLLYDFVDTRNQFHIDHVYPRSRFTVARLKQHGVDDEVARSLHDRIDKLPNLQLLEGTPNQEKSASFPGDWLQAHLPDGNARRDYCMRHDLSGLVDSIEEFENFYETRRSRIMERIRALVQVQSDRPAPDISLECSGVSRATTPPPAAR